MILTYGHTDDGGALKGAQLTSFALALRPDDAQLGSSPRLRALFQPLVLVDSMNHLRPKIAGGVVALVDTLVQPFNCSIDSALAVLLDQSCTDSTTVAASNGFLSSINLS
jgi:hypothetical protein